MNKLLYMYRFYYLPFSIQFREGKTQNDILPMIEDAQADDLRLIKADELQKLDEEWGSLKDAIRKKSLFLNTPVPLNESVRISSHLASHRVRLSRSAFDSLNLNERIAVIEALKNKPNAVQAQYKQLLFAKSLLNENDVGKFNFIMVAASWCESSREYRVMIENYFRTFLPEQVNIHSLIVDDPKEQIFEHPFLRELFPNEKSYSHQSIPKFLAVDETQGNTVVLEEGEALAALYDRYFKEKRGYLDDKSSLFGLKKSTKPIRIRELASPR